MSFFTYALIAVLLLGAFTLGACAMRDHLTGHFWPVGRWCATCYSWESDFYAHIYWCHPTHADCTTPGPQLPTPVADDDDDDHPLIDWRQANRDQWFAPGNDAIWGPGNWVRCDTCPLDDAGNAVYHHRDAHAEEASDDQ